MQVHMNISPDLDEGAPFAQMNPGSGEPFGILRFSEETYFSVHSVAEAERVIAVAVQIIAMFGEIGKPHVFQRPEAGAPVSTHHCVHCGMLSDSPDHVKPVAKCRYCEIEPATEGDFCEACAPAVLLATGSLDATAVAS
jgi:hypothetical protein